MKNLMQFSLATCCLRSLASYWFLSAFAFYLYVLALISNFCQRKLERELVQYGGAPTATGSEPDECDDEHEQDDGVDEPIASVSGNSSKLVGKKYAYITLHSWLAESHIWLSASLTCSSKECPWL